MVLSKTRLQYSPGPVVAGEGQATDVPHVIVVEKPENGLDVGVGVGVGVELDVGLG